jgi:REP element-mobilizing transposase RayT
MSAIDDNYIQFFTAVCYDWLSLLKSEECKKVIINALQYRVKTKQVAIAGFVIMPNHIHIIWRIAAGTQRENFQRDLLKITAKGIIDVLSRTEPGLIKNITVNL